MRRVLARWDDRLQLSIISLGKGRWLLSALLLFLVAAGLLSIVKCLRSGQSYYFLQKKALLKNKEALTAKITYYNQLKETLKKNTVHLLAKEELFTDNCTKDICGLLLEEISTYPLKVSSYSSASSETTQGAITLQIKGSYQALLDACTVLHEKYPHVRCRIESLQALTAAEVSAVLIVEYFSTYKNYKKESSV